MISIVVVGRDRFSLTFKCLETLIAHTPGDYELIVVLGGVPKKIQDKLVSLYGKRAHFIFKQKFLNPAESRNLGLRAAKTDLAVLMDNDLYVRPGWLPPLLECQRETGAAMVVPLILDAEKNIHTAGNDLYITHENGKAYGSKVLRFHFQTFCESSNLKRARTDYGELHCQLVEAETARRLGVYDENILEVGECDSGLTWQKAGCELWFEPRSVVFYQLPDKITDPDDIRFFSWKWNMRETLKGYLYFRQKWNLDISEYHYFREFLVTMNNKLGLLPRAFPCRFSLWIDHWLKIVHRRIENLFNLWGYAKARLYGYNEWLKDDY